jgi:hypothetical protein
MDNSLAKLLSEWLAFAKDVQPSCAAGSEWLDVLRNSTEAELQKLTNSQNSGKPLVSLSLPPDTEVEKWFAGDKVDDAKFWADAPFRDNGDVVGIVIDALKYFSGGNAS